MTFNAPYLNYERVGEYVKAFLEKYHPSLQLPIPIEQIIESDLGLHIHPFPNMYRIFRQNGFLGLQRKVIYIDEYQYDNFVENSVIEYFVENCHPFVLNYHTIV